MRGFLLRLDLCATVDRQVRSSVDELARAHMRGRGNGRQQLRRNGPGIGFLDLGLDSDDVMELAQRLSTHLELPVEVTTILAYPTADALARHLWHKRGRNRQRAAASQLCLCRSLILQQIRLLHYASELPGDTRCGGIESPQFCELLSAGGDAVHAVPMGHWATEQGEQQSLSAAEYAATRYLARVSGADLFDERYFGISGAEAATMDPQQRRLLEVTAALPRGLLYSNALVGVFVGISNADFWRQPAVGNVYDATGGAPSIAAGRISFCFGLNGACTTVDAACASALSALNVAVLNVCRGLCCDAVTAAASLCLSSRVSTAYARAGMLSSAGRCFAFDSRAHGYVRGEGVGTLFLGSTTGAPSVVRVAAVRHDGKSASLTSPNGKAQNELVHDAWAKAALEPEERGRHIEAHGTGTALGDAT